MKKLKEEVFSGLVLQADIDFVSEGDIEKYPMLYEHLEEGDVKRIYLEEIILHSADTNCISDLEMLKQDIEDLILKLKQRKNNE